MNHKRTYDEIEQALTLMLKFNDKQRTRAERLAIRWAYTFNEMQRPEQEQQQIYSHQRVLLDFYQQGGEVTQAIQKTHPEIEAGHQLFSRIEHMIEQHERRADEHLPEQFEIA